MDNTGEVAGRFGVTMAVQPKGPTSTAANLDIALAAALARAGQHTVISPAGDGTYRLSAFGPAQTLFPARVASVSAPGAAALTINGGERLYVLSDPATPRRWVDVPNLAAFYRLPAGDQTRARNLWADLLAKVVPTIEKATARAMPVPILRTTLAQHCDKAFPVSTIHRGDPPVDAGGIVNGVTLPTLRLPLREPDCYLPVIGQVEGKLESINAWDTEAGVSLGVIQFNADRAAIFQFLWQLWIDDLGLFDSALTKPLGWKMIWDDGHPDLLIDTVTLHGRTADRARNAGYLQTGKIGGTGRNGPFRRKVAAALRDCVAWPHVQDMIVDTSAWYLKSALNDIHQAGIGPLSGTAPDHDTYVLTAMLLSGRVRYSSCLAQVLKQLQQFPTTAAKLANWKVALAATTSPCPTLLARLTNQQKQAAEVFTQIQRLLA